MGIMSKRSIGQTSRRTPLSLGWVVPLALIALLPLRTPLATMGAAIANAAEDSEVHRLQVERLDIAKRLLEQELVRFKHGASSLDDVLRASDFVVRGEIEVAQSKDEIVAAREKQVDIAKQLEAIVTQKQNVGVLRASDADLSTYARLGAEIELLKAKQIEK